jgi:hypothetical protein
MAIAIFFKFHYRVFYFPVQFGVYWYRNIKRGPTEAAPEVEISLKETISYSLEFFALGKQFGQHPCLYYIIIFVVNHCFILLLFC